MPILNELARSLTLGALLTELRHRFGGFDLMAHHQQGEFHHDLILRVLEPSSAAGELPGSVLAVSTNCNGGIKEVLAFDDVPTADALWKHRCPTSDEFDGDLPPLRGLARTLHWFDPCELLTQDARSELRPEHRQRARGGGWEPNR
jgi:hypothetical protein